MQYFKQNQLDCVLLTVTDQILKQKEKHTGFKFEGLFPTLVEVNKYQINAVITPENEKYSYNPDFEEFCDNNGIIINYSDCLK